MPPRRYPASSFCAVIYHVFDFDQRRSLGRDEVVLALECTSRGLAKISRSTNALIQDQNAGTASRFLPGELPASEDIERVVGDLFGKAARGKGAEGKKAPLQSSKSVKVPFRPSISMDDFAGLGYRHTELGSWLRSWQAPGTTGVLLHKGGKSSPSEPDSAARVSGGKTDEGRGVGSGESKERSESHDGDGGQAAVGGTYQASSGAGVGGGKRPRGVRPVALIGGGAFDATGGSSVAPDAKPRPLASGGSHALTDSSSGPRGSSLTFHEEDEDVFSFLRDQNSAIARSAAEIAAKDPDLFRRLRLSACVDMDGTQPHLPGHSQWHAATTRSQRAWVAQVPLVRPRDEEPAARDLPDVCVSMEWIYGFSCHGMRNSAAYIHTGEILYLAGTNAIILDPTEGVGKHQQRHFQGHRDSITAQAVCLSSDGSWSAVATAELGPMPRICVWDPIDCVAIAEGRCPHGRNVSHMAWSPLGSVLLSIGTDARRTLCLWTVNSEAGRLELLSSMCLLSQAVAPVRSLDVDAQLGRELSYPADCIAGLQPGEAAESTLWRREIRRLKNRGGSKEEEEALPRPLHEASTAARLGPGKVLAAGFVSHHRAVVCGIDCFWELSVDGVDVEHADQASQISDSARIGVPASGAGDDQEPEPMISASRALPLAKHVDASIRPGVFGKGGPAILTATAPHPTRDDACVCGTLSGDLVVWAGNIEVGTVPAHSKSPVTVLSTTRGSGLVSGSLGDSKIAVFGPSLERLRSIDIGGLGLLSSSLQSLQWDHVAERLLVGTHGGELLELSEHDGSSLHLEGALVHSHFRGFAAAVCSHPTKDEFVTVGDDASLRVWDSLDRRMIGCIKLPTAARAVSFHPSGQYVCVGLGSPDGSERSGYYRPSDALYEPAATERANREGAYVVFSTEDWSVVCAARDSRKWITAVKYSPDGSTLAVASADRSVYIYDTHVSTVEGEQEAAAVASRKLKGQESGKVDDVGVQVLTAKLPPVKKQGEVRRVRGSGHDGTKEYTPRTKLDGHTSPVFCIDFSADSTIVRTASRSSLADTVSERGSSVGNSPGLVSAESAVDVSQASYGTGSNAYLPESVSKGVVAAGTESASLAVDVSSVARDAVLRALAEGGYESMHWRADTGEPYRANGLLAAQEWFSSSSPLAWSSAGFWDGCGVGSDATWQSAWKKLTQAPPYGGSAKKGGSASAGEALVLPSLTATNGLLSERSGAPVDIPRSQLRPLHAEEVRLHLQRHSPLAMQQFIRRYEDIATARVCRAGDWIVAGDCYGCVRVRQFPADNPDSAELSLDAHSSGSDVALDIAAGDGRILSLGQSDRSIVQWVVEPCPSPVAARETNSQAHVPMPCLDTYHASLAAWSDRSSEIEATVVDSVVSAVQGASRREDLGQYVLPKQQWMVSAVLPSNESIVPHRGTFAAGGDESVLARSSIAIHAKAPLAIQLHGSAGASGVGNAAHVASLGEGSFVYGSGHRAVVLSPKSGTIHEAGGWVRRVYDGHTSTISAMVSATAGPDLDKWMVATGTASSAAFGGFGEVRVWNPSSMTTLVSLGGIAGPVLSLDFGRSEAFEIVSAWGDASNYVCVHDWRSGALVARIPTSNSIAVGVLCSVAGEGFLRWTGHQASFWTLDGRNGCRRPVQLGRVSSARLPADVGQRCSLIADMDEHGMQEDSLASDAEESEMPRVGNIFVSAAWAGHEALFGMRSGALVLLDGVDAAAACRGHQGAVAMMRSLFHAEINLVVSGGLDGYLRIWTTDLHCLAEVPIHETSPSLAVGVSAISISVSPQGAFIAAGTQSGEALVTEIELSPGGEQHSSEDGDQSTIPSLHVHKPVVPVTGHSQGGIRALATHPSKLMAATGGDDGYVAIWDVRFPRVLGTVRTASGISALAFHPGGEFLAIGLGGDPVGSGMKREGTLIVVEISSLEPVFEGRETASSCSCIAHSPDGNTLAVSTVEGSIYLFDISAKYDLRGTYSGVRGGANAIDFSCDGSLLRAAAHDGALHYVESRSAEDASHSPGLKSKLWQSHSVPVGFELQGMGAIVEDGSQVVCGDRQPIHASLRGSQEDRSESDPASGAGSAEGTSSFHFSDQGGYFLAGDTSGRISLVPFPCVGTDSGFAPVAPAHAGRAPVSHHGGPEAKYAKKAASKSTGGPAAGGAVDLTQAVGSSSSGQTGSSDAAKNEAVVLARQRTFQTDFGQVRPTEVSILGHDGPVQQVRWCNDAVHFVSIGSLDSQMHVWKLHSSLSSSSQRDVVSLESVSAVVDESETAALIAPRAKFRAAETAIRRCMDWGEWLPAGVLPGIEAALAGTKGLATARSARPGSRASTRPGSKSSARPLSARLDGPSRARTLGPLKTTTVLESTKSGPRPWIRDAVDPTAVERPVAEPPEASLRLCWCAGYAGRTGLRNNAHFAGSSDRIVYNISSLGVSLDLASGQQQHFLRHGAQEVLGTAASSSGEIIATAAFEVEAGWDYERPRVRLWRSSTCQQVGILPATHRRGMACFAFIGRSSRNRDHYDVSTDTGPLADTMVPKAPRKLSVRPLQEGTGVAAAGSSAGPELLVCIGQDDAHTITVHASQSSSWDDAEFVCSAKLGAGRPLGIADCSGTANDNADFVVVGEGFISFVRVDRELKMLQMVPGRFGSTLPWQSVTCAATCSGCLYVGTSGGQVVHVADRQCKEVFAAHEGAVTAIHSIGEYMATGGADGRVLLWKHTSFGLKRAGTIDVATLGAGAGASSPGIQARPSLDPRVRSVCISPDGSHQRILIGTFGCELYVAASGEKAWQQQDAGASAVKLSQQGQFPVTLVACGHAGHESRALVCHPLFPDVFASAGDDHTLRLWSAGRAREIVQVELGGMCRAIDWSSDGSQLVVGLGGRFGEGGTMGASEQDGMVLLLQADNLLVLAEQRDTRLPVNVLRFDPSGHFVACGSRDYKVYVYEVVPAEGFAAASGAGTDSPGSSARATKSALELKVVCDGASAPILAIDWDSTSQILQVNDEAGELHFFRVETGERLEHPSDAKDMAWVQQKCPASAATRYAWRHPDFGIDCTSAHVSQDRDLLVMGESMGQLKLLRCPASHPDAKARSYAGHVGAVRQVAFTSDRSRVVSMGAKDGMIAVWQVVRGRSAPILTLPWFGSGIAPAKYGFAWIREV